LVFQGQVFTETRCIMRYGDMLKEIRNPDTPASRVEEIARIFNEFGAREDKYKSWTQFVDSKINPAAIGFPFQRIYENEIEIDTASLQIPIPPGFTHLLVTGIGRTTATPGTAQEQSLNFTFNGDVATNYQWSYVGSRSGVAVVDDNNTQSNLPFGMFNTDNCDADSASSFFTFIPHYNGNFYKMCLSIIAGQKTTTATGTESALMTGFWKSTSPIRTMEVVPGGGLGGNLKTGSLIVVYGMN
jgi:hypothetical protein